MDVGYDRHRFALFLLSVRGLPWRIDSVPKGQWEAATALNMTTAQTYKRLIIPQAIPPAIPGLGNYLVGIFKDTPMLSVIGVAELIHTANAIGSETWRYLKHTPSSV